jgi:hypothetical protein
MQKGKCVWMYQCFSHLVITFDVTFVLDVEMAVVIEK